MTLCKGKLLIALLLLEKEVNIKVELSLWVQENILDSNLKIKLVVDLPSYKIRHEENQKHLIHNHKN